MLDSGSGCVVERFYEGGFSFERMFSRTELRDSRRGLKGKLFAFGKPSFISFFLVDRIPFCEDDGKVAVGWVVFGVVAFDVVVDFVVGITTLTWVDRSWLFG